MGHEMGLSREPRLLKWPKATPWGACWASGPRTAGVGDHIMYAQTSSEPGKPVQALRVVTAGDRGKG